MKYDFDTVIDRRNTGSVKWDLTEENELPMWVADMDFKAAPEILEAVQKRLDNGVFGYSLIPDEWALSYDHWWESRHGFKTDASWYHFAIGVIPILSSAIREFTRPGENILLQSPVYNAFFSIIKGNGRKVLESPLIYRDGAFSMAFDDLELKLSDPKTTMMFLCNPHNPVAGSGQGRSLKESETSAKSTMSLCFPTRSIAISQTPVCCIHPSPRFPNVAGTTA